MAQSPKTLTWGEGTSWYAFDLATLNTHNGYMRDSCDKLIEILKTLREYTLRDESMNIETLEDLAIRIDAMSRDINRDLKFNIKVLKRIKQ